MYSSCGKSCDNDYECTIGCDYMKDMPLAMAYVPWQEWGEVCDPCKALEMGTIFPELNLPFLGRSCLKR